MYLLFAQGSNFSLGLLAWFLWLVMALLTGVGFYRERNYYYGGNGLILLILLFVILWEAFGFIVSGK